MISFEIRGIKITVDIGFLAVIAIMSMSGSSLYWYAFLTCVIHESGHMIQLMLCGGETERLEFSVAGIRMIPRRLRISSVFEDISVLLGGSFSNLLAAVLMLLLSHGEYNIFIYMNLLSGIFNLLPFRALDGGSIVVCLIEYFAEYNRQSMYKKLLKIFNILLCVVLLIVFRQLIVQNITLIVIFFYIIISDLIKKD